MFELPNLNSYMESYKTLDSQLVEGTDDPANLLITFPLAKGVPASNLVQIQYDELTAYCPWTAFPDQGSIMVEYMPSDKLLELKSFKFYLLAFRDVHITQEHLAQKLHHDLYEVLSPNSLKIVLDYMPRGGLHTVFTIG